MYQAALAFVTVLAVAEAQIPTPIPLPSSDPGFRYNAASVGAPIRLDVALELNCPDSFDAWPYLKNISNFYGPDVLDFVFYQFQLPYHRWGHLCTQGFYAVQSIQGDASALAYFEFVLDNWSDFSSGATVDQSHNDMLALLASHANTATGIDTAEFIDGVSAQAATAIFNWKWQTRRGASGTPWYYLNGVDLGINYALTFDDLRSLIDPLLPTK